MAVNSSEPPVTRETIFLSFDIESNGLHGAAFAVGAVLVRADGKLLDEFTGRCAIAGPVDEWVQKNVLPVITDMAEDHGSARSLRDAFWKWYTASKEQADYVLVDNGYPVEMRFLLACQDDDIEERYWGHPFPLIDVASLLLQAGIKPPAVRAKLAADRIRGDKVVRHHPRWDAWVSVQAALWALEATGQLPAA